MVRVPGDTDDPDDIVDDPPVWPFSIVILHGAIVGALLAWVVGCSLSNLRYFLGHTAGAGDQIQGVSFSCGTAFEWLSATAMPFSAVWKPLSRQS